MDAGNAAAQADRQRNIILAVVAGALVLCCCCAIVFGALSLVNWEDVLRELGRAVPAVLAG